MSSDNNGNHIDIPGIGGAGQVNPAVQVLENLLKEAKSGRINSLGVVAVDALGNVIMCGGVGGRLGDLYVLLGSLQIDVIAQIRASMQGQQQSKIIPVRGGI